MSRAVDKKKKTQAQISFEELTTLNAKIDDDMRETKKKSDQKSEELNEVYDEKMKVLRCRTLRIKKLNGGLSVEEETELAELEK